MKTKEMFDKVSYWTDWTAIGLIHPFNGSEHCKYIRGGQGGITGK